MSRFEEIRERLTDPFLDPSERSALKRESEIRRLAAEVALDILGDLRSSFYYSGYEEDERIADRLDYVIRDHREKLSGSDD